MTDTATLAAATVTVPVYSHDVTDYWTPGNSGAELTFGPIVASAHVGHSAVTQEPIGIDMSWSDSELIGHILAPAGTRVVLCDDDLMVVLPGRRTGLWAAEAVEMARTGIDSLGFRRARRRAT